MTKLNEKMLRFLELSKKFSQSEESVFGRRFNTHLMQGNICFNSDNQITTISTRSEILRQESRDLEKLSSEYDEFFILRNELITYLNAKQEINQ